MLAYIGYRSFLHQEPPTFVAGSPEIIRDPSVGFYKDFSVLVKGRKAQERFLVVQWIRGFMKDSNGFGTLERHRGESNVPTSLPRWVIDTPGTKASYPLLRNTSEGILLLDKPGVTPERIPGKRLTSGNVYMVHYDFRVNVYDKKTTPDRLSSFRSPTDPLPLASYEWDLHDEWEVP